MDLDSVIVHIEGPGELVSFSIGIPSTDTFLQLKQKIQEKTGVTVERQSLLDKYELEPLLDNSTLQSRGFKRLSEVVLMVLPLSQGTQINITISIPPGTNDFNLIMEDKQTVLELKQKICSINNNIDLNRIQLYHHFTEMQDSAQLYKYFVNEGSKIIMLLK